MTVKTLSNRWRLSKYKRPKKMMLLKQRRPLTKQTGKVALEAASEILGKLRQDSIVNSEQVENCSKRMSSKASEGTVYPTGSNGRRLLQGCKLQRPTHQ
ncbi:hypothetical protein GDO78_012869 [Eleutherodactylus coqui]|uniref:Uncharacterized protein n=1 Tax=Eleutherodactylus coqui TaxID=57060 RepID=A0A8J6F2M1_ELECQ|nr:hypothetical protein GDO78_012869 [Eleutherodactylus coqui]